MLGNLEDKVFLLIVDCRVGDIYRTINRWKVVRWKPDIDDRSYDLYNLPCTSRCSSTVPPY